MGLIHVLPFKACQVSFDWCSVPVYFPHRQRHDDNRILRLFNGRFKSVNPAVAYPRPLQG